MSITRKTVFFPDNTLDEMSGIVLSDDDPIIEKSDVDRGYISKSELLEYFGDKIKQEDITEKSCVVEFVTVGDGGDVIHYSLPVR